MARLCYNTCYYESMTDNPAQDNASPAQGNTTAAQPDITDWKALARTWENRAKENRDNLETARNSLDAWNTAFPNTEPKAVKGRLDDLTRRLEATIELVNNGANPKTAFDSISFMHGLSEATDIGVYCKNWAGKTRVVRPTGRNDDSNTDHNAEALRLLLGKN